VHRREKGGRRCHPGFAGDAKRGHVTEKNHERRQTFEVEVEQSNGNALHPMPKEMQGKERSLGKKMAKKMC